jgi:hypothetical protein
MLACLHAGCLTRARTRCLQLQQVNELLLLGDPILLAPADDLADAGAAAGALHASSSQEALQGNELLQAGLAGELVASGRGLLASSYQDAAQRCSRAFRWARADQAPACPRARPPTHPSTCRCTAHQAWFKSRPFTTCPALPPALRCYYLFKGCAGGLLAMRRVACAEHVLPLEGAGGHLATREAPRGSGRCR